MVHELEAAEIWLQTELRKKQTEVSSGGKYAFNVQAATKHLSGLMI